MGGVFVHDQVQFLVGVGAGGQLTLYRPGQPPESAPPVPLAYQLVKSVGHDGMALYEIAVPHVSTAHADQLWRTPLEMYRAQNRTAPESPDALDLSDETRSILRRILECNLTFVDECLANRGYRHEELEAFVRSTVQRCYRAIGIAFQCPSTARVAGLGRVAERTRCAKPVARVTATLSKVLRSQPHRRPGSWLLHQYSACIQNRSCDV